MNPKACDSQLPNIPHWGRRLIVGFTGPDLPQWLSQMAHHCGLGGVILFDTCVYRKSNWNNIISPEQLKQLISQIHSLPGRPKVFIDQEGGKVRRLKEDRGFSFLPSAKDYALMAPKTRKDFLRRAFEELAQLGVDVNLAPVIDVLYDENSADIGRYDRSFSSRVDVVRECAWEWIEMAKDYQIELCLKHFPGLGGAQQNSHEALTYLKEVPQEQLALFLELIPHVPGHFLLVSHAHYPPLDPVHPLSVSSQAVGYLKSHFPKVQIVTDDLQMKGLMHRMTLVEAIHSALKAGVDYLCIGNNLRDDSVALQDLIFSERPQSP
ncbi:MAG: hypothetical protein NZ480_04010 [Bdellovibrionaceae bacterium]|nr:hypothetical protein [Pseudobdellovibrionaceae bacterium]MDW8189991.1 glycoside hydrolase family 3 N-terminal domain-containing protein [Pseudobdellovibrionaceae bacterium]